MRIAVTSLVLCAVLAGCAGTPPKPAKCQGTFHPINAQGIASAPADAMTLAGLCQGGAHGRQA